MYFCEKLENKLRDVVRLTLAFWLLPWKNFLWVMVKKKFPQDIKEDGGNILTKMSMRWILSHHIPQLIFHLLIQISYFSYHFPCYYQTEPKRPCITKIASVAINSEFHHQSLGCHNFCDKCYISSLKGYIL